MVGYVDRGSKTKLILPFDVSAKDRIKPSSKNMTKAAIFCLAEYNRKKGEGHILRKTDEKLIFIAETCYPIWSVPWSGGTLLFDGLGTASYTFSYNKLPSVQAFKKDIRRNAKKWRDYSTALSRNTDYFKNFIGKEEITIEGLIAHPEFLQDFSSYSSSMEKMGKTSASKVILHPIFNRTEISTSVKSLTALRERINKDIKNLAASMKLLSTTSQEKVKAIRKEIQKIRKNFDNKIQKAKPRITKKIRKIQDKYDKKIYGLSKRFEIQLQRLHKDLAKFEKTQTLLKNEIESCKAKKQSWKRGKNKRNQNQWTLKLEKTKKKLPTIEKKIKQIKTKIEKLETAKNHEISKVKMECTTCIEESKKILGELEASRNAKTKMVQLEIASIEETSSFTMNQINEMEISKKESLIILDKISMTKKPRGLIYLPFYLIRYDLDSKKRYDVYPPSIVSDMGITAKLKGVFGATKMIHLLQPRSKAITLFLNQLPTLIKKNPMLEKELTETGIQNSVLRTKKLRIEVKRGLEELKNEKWISKNELQILSKLLYIHTPSTYSKKRIELVN